jgi:hypothetical protein
MQKGLAKNVTWSNFRTYNVTFPIFVTQTYWNQGSSQTQLENGSTGERPNNSSVVMRDFRWENFTGTINTFNPGDGSCVTDVSLCPLSVFYMAASSKASCSLTDNQALLVRSTWGHKHHQDPIGRDHGVQHELFVSELFVEEY